MKVFAEKSHKARRIAEATAAQPDAGQPEPGAAPSEDRLAQGFELLFGAHIQQQREELTRQQAALLERLGAVESATARHQVAVEELHDKCRATLEREQDEFRRRKNIDDELRQMVLELRALLTTTVAELHDRTARLEASVEEQLAQVQAAQSSEQTTRFEEIFRHLEETLDELKTSKLDRSELAGFFSSLARRFDGSDA